MKRRSFARKILIAGGSGYIGSVLTPLLLEREYEVDVVDLLWFGNNLPANVKVIQKGVLELEEDDLRGYDQVIFLAGLSNDAMSEYSPVQAFVENASAPAYLAYLAKLSGVKRFIYGGTSSVYGFTPNKLCDEICPTSCNLPYSISKLQGETGCLHLQDNGFSVICLRQGTVSGFSPRMRFDLIVNTMFKDALSKQVITVNNPAIQRPILAIQDAVAAFLKAVEASQEISGVFNISSGNYTVSQVADYVKFGLKNQLNINVKIKVKHIQDLRNYKISIDKAMSILKFMPRYKVNDIVQDLTEHVNSFKYLENDKYYNIRIFKQLNQVPL